jgi:glutaconate CoA-transferase subunit A
MSAAEAVKRFIKPGCQIALGGFTINRNPMHLAREIIRQNLRNLHLVAHSHGQALDMLIGAGCVDRLEIAYSGSGRFAPTCICFRRFCEQGRLAVEDYSNYQMSLRFLAGALGLPFIPSPTGHATDLADVEGFSQADREISTVASRKIAWSDNPFGKDDEKVLLLPALNPDVALVHAQTVGEDGTVRIGGLTFLDLEQVKSARAVIVSCEEIVPTGVLREDPDKNSLPPFMVDAYVSAPYGAHPTACHFFYDYDPGHLKLYAEFAGDDEAFAKYIQEWIFNTPSLDDYVAKLGPETVESLRADPATGYSRGLDRR